MKEVLRRLLIGAAWGLALMGMAWSQAPVQTIPYPAYSAGGNVSGTITSTSVFQQLWPASTVGQPRKGCTIRNESASNVMYVTEGFGIVASSTTNAVKLNVGDQYYCGVGGVALQGQINISGTSEQDQG